ncbi:hypothetical protein yfred0001_2870 [Yersinia frederiksenii ATCC 33641]|nr:hypothetical protein yfred0001_2870 [Yersinia frederiksenii ATCC 33641]
MDIIEVTLWLKINLLLTVFQMSYVGLKKIFTGELNPRM